MNKGPLPSSYASKANQRAKGGSGFVQLPRLSADALRHEEAIVWEDDPSRLPYVREDLVDLAATRRRPLRSPGRRVGYSVLRHDAPRIGGFFVRRVFWVAPHDRSEGGDAYTPYGVPCEAVDPLTVQAGVLGRLTCRAWGRCFCSQAEDVE